MEMYKAPAADLGADNTWRLRLLSKIGLFPLFAIGACVTWGLTLWLSFQVPVPAGTRAFKIAFILALSAVTSVAATAPWWIPIGRLYEKRALLVGAIIGLAPAALRIFLSGGGAKSATVTVSYLFGTAGIVAAMALGSYLVSRRLSANNSSKPTPLRGAA